MSQIIHLECRLKGHTVLCEQQATLLPEGGGILEHTHTCTRCRQIQEFDVQELEPEFDQMLRMTFKPSMTRITVDLAGTVHPRVH